MNEYNIYTNKPMPLIRTLWREFLYKDNVWFFSLYKEKVDFMRVRTDKRIADLEGYLHKMKISYDQSPYNPIMEAQTITGKYFDELTSIYHWTSILALKMGSKEGKTLIERMVHMFANQQQLTYWDEANLISGLALGKAYTAGKYST